MINILYIFFAFICMQLSRTDLRVFQHFISCHGSRNLFILWFHSSHYRKAIIFLKEHQIIFSGNFLKNDQIPVVKNSGKWTWSRFYFWTFFFFKMAFITGDFLFFFQKRFKLHLKLFYYVKCFSFICVNLYHKVILN